MYTVPSTNKLHPQTNYTLFQHHNTMCRMPSKHMATEQQYHANPLPASLVKLMKVWCGMKCTVHVYCVVGDNRQHLTSWDKNRDNIIVLFNYQSSERTHYHFMHQVYTYMYLHIACKCQRLTPPHTKYRACKCQSLIS